MHRSGPFRCPRSGPGLGLDDPVRAVPSAAPDPRNHILGLDEKLGSGDLVDRSATSGG